MEPLIKTETNSFQSLLDKKPDKVIILFPNDSITIKSRSFCVVEVKYNMNNILDESSDSNNINL